MKKKDFPIHVIKKGKKRGRPSREEMLAMILLKQQERQTRDEFTKRFLEYIYFGKPI